MSSSPLQLSAGGSSPVASSDVPPTPADDLGGGARTPSQRSTPAGTPAGLSPAGQSLRSPSLRSASLHSPGGMSSPLSLLRTPSGRSRATPSSVGRSDLGRSQGSRRSAGGMASDDFGESGSSGPNTTIWGTNVSVQETQKGFRAFFDNFVDEANFTDRPFYHEYLDRLLEVEEYYVNLDCSHLRAYDSSLYHKLVSYPQEVVPICDLVVQDVFCEMHPERSESGQRFQIRCFNLGKEDRLRDLDPMDIDKLVAIKGMVTRTTAIIPDLKMAFFECSTCLTPQEVFIERGQIAEPQVCTNTACQAKLTMRIVHNRSVFTDKQIVRIQEAPEHIPEGETPQTCSMCAWDGLVDVAKPGDRVEVTGVYRAVPIRLNPRMRNMRSIYKTYVDIVHVRKLERSKRMQAEGEEGDAAAQFSTSYEESNELAEAAAARVAAITELSTHADVYTELSKALSPSVWELDDVKRGLLLMLFGGTHKTFDEESTGGTKRRGEINVLLMGDPGTSKSQLLQYVHKVAPRGVYTSGKGSSAVGLTAYVTRDPETREFVLESGALVLSDRGVCCIDEFDKMSDGARSILHEAMEQQTVSVAKAGIICSLNARTSVLASANPIDSKYDASKSVVANINLGPTLLSRFDLIYLILDKPNERSDRMLAEHLLALYQPGAKSAPGISQKALCDYITYAKAEVHPRLSAAAADQLITEYVEMRKIGSAGRDPTKRVITATPRQLESLVRLSEAHARLHLRPTVELVDVAEAVRLMRVATQSAATDPDTGTIDMDLITTGRSAASRTAIAQMAEALREIFGGMQGQTLSFDEVRRMISEDTQVEIGINELRDALTDLANDGIIRMPRPSVVSICS